MDPKDGRVVSNFIIQALKGEDITIYGDGTQTRSFCYVDDLVNGLVKMMESDITGPVNLGNPSERTILDFAKLIIEITGTNSKIVHKPLPSDDPVKRRPDITRAQKELGWTPQIFLISLTIINPKIFFGKIDLKHESKNLFQNYKLRIPSLSMINLFLD